MTKVGQNAAYGARLRDRAIKAGLWTLGAYGFDLFTRLFSNLILARLLFPEAFGAVAAAMALITGLVLLSDLGLRGVVIQSPHGEEDSFLHCAWVVQLWHSVVAWALLVGACILIHQPFVRSAIPAGSIYANPLFGIIAGTLGLTILFGGAESTCLPLNARRLNYKPIALIGFFSRIASLPVTLLWAWLWPSVWALLAGILFGSAVRTLLSHFMLPGPKMSLHWERGHLQEIFRFGRWNLVSSSATFIIQQGDVVLLGLLIPSSVLGLYSIAKLLASTGEGLLDQISNSLAVPVLGAVYRDNPANIRSRYYHFRLPIDTAAGILSGLLVVAGAFAVSFLYDVRYAPAGPMVQILAVGLVTYPFLLIGNVFTAAGEFHITATSTLVRAFSFLACSLIGYSIGHLDGFIAGIALHRIVPSVVIIYIASKRHWIEPLKELRIVPVFLAGLVIGKFVIFVSTALGVTSLRKLISHLK